MEKRGSLLCCVQLQYRNCRPKVFESGPIAAIQGIGVQVRWDTCIKWVTGTPRVRGGMVRTKMPPFETGLVHFCVGVLGCASAGLLAQFWYTLGVGFGYILGVLYCGVFFVHFWEGFRHFGVVLGGFQA